jgi:hypothetical protein
LGGRAKYAGTAAIRQLRGAASRAGAR